MRPCLSRPNRRKSICRHFKIPPECSSLSSLSSASSSVIFSTASSSPLQITICLSPDGNSDASNDASVVNEDPSDVLVKLKKPTADCRLELELCMVPDSSESNRCASVIGSIGNSGVTSRFDIGLKEGLMLVVDFVRSGYEREVAEDIKDVLELSHVGE